jgi:hypothetical protein
MIRRRTLLTFSGAALAACAAPFRLAAASIADATAKALATSNVIYITPLKKGDVESTCHAEVWFVFDSGAIYVVTSSKAWRARAVGLGLNQARMWVGEFGTWKGAKEAYRKAPELNATASLIDDAGSKARVLDVFGKKYHAEWSDWGPKFKNGLADGSRVMLRYTPIA